MFTVFRYTLGRLRGQILGWGIGLALFAAYMVGFYDNLMDMRNQFESVLENYPQELVALIGGVSDLFTPPGYINTYLFSFMPLILGIFAVLVGSGLIVSDEEGGRLDLILGHPVGRSKFFTGRLLASLVGTAAIVGLMWLGTILPLAGTTMDLSPSELALPYLSMLGMLLFYLTLGLLLSFGLPSRRLAATATGLILVGSFLVTMMARINEDLASVAAFSPLDYYQGGRAITGMEWGWLLGLLGFSLLFALLAWWRFERREIRVAGEGGWQLPSLRRGKERLGWLRVRTA